jgi:hypothetical protein
MPIWLWIAIAAVVLLGSLCVLAIFTPLFVPKKFREMCRVIRIELGDRLKEKHPEFEVIGEKQGYLVLRFRGTERVWDMSDVYSSVAAAAVDSSGKGRDPNERNKIYDAAIKSLIESDLFGSPKQRSESANIQSRELNPVATVQLGNDQSGPQGASAAFGEPDADREYQEFCARFCFKPGIKLVDFLNANQMSTLQNWFRPSTQEPEPKAFVRLCLNMLATNQNFWENTGELIFFIDGKYSQGGGPSKQSQEALAALSLVLDRKITTYFVKDINQTPHQFLKIQFAPKAQASQTNKT